MIDDDEPAAKLEKKPARLQPLRLESMGVAELEEYITELRAEIARAEDEIGRKQSHRSAADRFFKPHS